MTTTTNDPIAAAVAPVSATISESIQLATKPNWYAFTKNAAGEAEVRIYDVIGGFGVTADQFINELQAIDADTIHVRINTPGGEVHEGQAIYHALQRQKARIITHVDSLAASAGSIIAIAGAEVRMAHGSLMMIHNARAGLMGEASEMRDYADVLDKIDDGLAGMYAAKAGKGRKYWRTKMAAETWFTADEAIAEGLADAIDRPETKPTARFDKILAYNQIPDAVVQALGLKPNQPKPEPSPRGEVEPPAVSTKENSPMSESNPAAQAQAAPAAPTPPADSIGALNQQAIQGYVNNGRVLGMKEGKAAEIERMKAIMAACPGRPDLAINAFISNQDAATVKLAFDAAQAEQAKVSDELMKQHKEIARLQAVIATGGHPGVPINPNASASPAVPQDIEPEAQAQLEWDTDPMVRAQNGGDDGKKKWILYRTQVLKKNVNVFSKAS